jgi:hypothetical protein
MVKNSLLVFYTFGSNSQLPGKNVKDKEIKVT